MRRWLLVLSGVALLVGVASPARADDAVRPQQFSIEPTAGPPGTTITVRGHCTSAWGGFGVQLRRPVRDGAIHPIDTVIAMPDFIGNFTVTLTNKLAGAEQDATDPVDLEVITYCNPEHGGDQVASFASTRRTTRSRPTIIASLGPGQCGAAGVDAPCPAHFRGFTPDGSLSSFNRYLSATDGASHPGASVAVGDVNGDGQAEYAAGYSGGHALWSEKPGTDFIPAESFRPVSGPARPGGFYKGGVNVAFGDVDGDGKDELIQAADVGGGPRVIVNKLREFPPNSGCADCEDPALATFYAYDANFRGGVSIAAADIDGDGKDEIITGAGPGGGPHVRFFRGDGTPVGPGFYAYDAAFHGGITVAAGDIVGDGRPEIVTGPRGGGGPHVRVLMVDGTPVGPGFYAYDSAFGGGVAVAVGEAMPGGRDEIVTVPFADAPAHVRVFMSPTGDAHGVGFYAFQPTPSGARVAVVRD